jgi:hypothetical protein
MAADFFQMDPFSSLDLTKVGIDYPLLDIAES